MGHGRELFCRNLLRKGSLRETQEFTAIELCQQAQTGQTPHKAGAPAHQGPFRGAIATLGGATKTQARR